MTLLQRLRERYETIRTRLDAITTSVVQEDAQGNAQIRALTEPESNEIRSLTEEATALVPQIEAEVARVERDRQMSDVFARGAAATNVPSPGTPPAAPTGATNAGADGGADDADDARIRAQIGASSTTTQDRDPGIYTRSGHVEFGEHRGERTHSFFHDIVHAQEGDNEARDRLGRHHRALSNASQGAGLVPPVWLASEFEYLARQGRQVSDIVRRYPLGSDPRPITLPRQTAGTDSVVGQVTPENTHPSEANGLNTTTDVVTPVPTSGIQVVSRQMIDMDDPAIDAFVYGDMLAVYNTKVESQVCTAMITAAGSAVTTYASDATNFTASAAEDGVTDAAFGVWNARKLPADIVAMRVLRWGKFNKFRDTSGRRLYPTDESQIVNGSGRGSVTSPGSVGGLPVIGTDGLGTSGYAETILVARSQDTILFEGDMMRFRYEEVAGPESVKLGIWAYTAVMVRQTANSVRKLTITAA